MTKVLIIHVGGTFGMVKENNVCVVKNTNVLKQLTELSVFNYKKTDSNLSYKNNNNKIVYYDFIELDILKDSSDADSQDFLNYINVIKENYNNYTGFIIIHGTDTMAYASSALSFLIENISKPIIFTGSMIPISQPDTDAIDNLSGALEIISSDLIPNVYIFFNKKLFHGNKVSKVNAVDLNAFCSYSSSLSLVSTHAVVKFYDQFFAKIVRITLHPYMDYNLLENTFINAQAIYVEAYGCGNMPNKLFKFIEKYSEAKIIVIGSQCLYAKVMGNYEIGNRLLNLNNIINGKDIRSEAGLAKLVFLLSNFELNKVKSLYEKNLRGEISCD